MSKFCYLMLLLFFSFFSKITLSDDVINHKLWVYEKVSDMDVFGNRDLNMVKLLYETYNKVTFTFSGKNLTIKNDFLEDNKVCSIDYVKIKKTPTSYYLSEKTVALYERLFQYDGISLPKYIYILTSLFPGRECPSPYNEVLEVSDHLIVQDQNYILFFKEANADVKNKNLIEKGLSTYCQKENTVSPYDGLNKYSCFFFNMKLNNAYETFREMQVNHVLLRKKLPLINEFDNTNDAVISYEWQGDVSLKISIVKDSEKNIFSFNERSTGTSLEITEETQY